MDSRLKLTIPAEEIESGAWNQIKTALKLPYLKTLAIMPDVHAGYDLPIGGVALLDGYIWPGAVGYDIGCGMCFVNTFKTLYELPDLEVVYNRIMESIPVGFNRRSEPLQLPVKFPNASSDADLNEEIEALASIQLGTLGGGNHFIELGTNSKGEVGITIHSGSRKSGHSIGGYYMEKSAGPVPIKSSLGRAYYEDMTWALDYALANRAEMMIRCLQALELDPILMEDMVNENHNHAEKTPEGVLHRKGATPADEYQVGIIPANMRDGVWITCGRGNKEFLCSASHGAGRTMSRTKARKTLDPQAFSEGMKNILAPELKNLLDESPDAYKNIDDVLKAQKGVLVDIVDHFKPILVVKG